MVQIEMRTATWGPLIETFILRTLFLGWPLILLVLAGMIRGPRATKPSITALAIVLGVFAPLPMVFLLGPSGSNGIIFGTGVLVPEIYIWSGVGAMMLTARLTRGRLAACLAGLGVGVIVGTIATVAMLLFLTYPPRQVPAVARDALHRMLGHVTVRVDSMAAGDSR